MSRFGLGGLWADQVLGVLGVYPFLGCGGWRFRPYGESPFPNAEKVTEKACSCVRPARWGSGSLRCGIDPGAAPTVCFAAPPLAVFGCAKRSLRSHARINPSAQPSDVARGSRSRAAAELTLILLSGAACAACGLYLIFPVGAAAGCDLLILILWELAFQRWRPDSRPCSGGMHSIYLWEIKSGTRACAHCFEWGGCAAWGIHNQNCGSWLASDGGLTADQVLAECTQFTCGRSRAVLELSLIVLSGAAAPHGAYTIKTVGAGLPAMAA